jgi:hypothetical protein
MREGAAGVCPNAVDAIEKSINVLVIESHFMARASLYSSFRMSAAMIHRYWPTDDAGSRQKDYSAFSAKKKNHN